ncbi:MAG TPA: ABC transporter substrate-binding protein [Stellaceae bacterium]|nr:ABC transporter substrate-binding protein [Stellaceae bacterium]
MRTRLGLTRRDIVKVGVAAGALTVPWARRAAAAEPIKIGAPLALTGPLGSVGQQLKRGCELWVKVQNAKGGLLGRPIQLLVEDTGGNPADAVRKAQEMVERDRCNIFTGITLSSEALAVVPKLDEWNAIFISSDNGDGRLTAESFVPNFFRSNQSAPMGARAVSLFLRSAPYKNFYAIGMDYAWGRNSVAVFESEMKQAKKNFVGSVFSPIGTKDFSTYITKIRQSGADACYVTMAGDDYNAFLAQAAQYQLPEKVQLLSEVIDLTVPRAVGDAAVGLISSMRYCFRLDNPKNKEFVEIWKKEYNAVPDNNEGEQWQALQFLAAAAEKAKGFDTAALRGALETTAIDDIKGHVAMRKCDHQAVQDGIVVKLGKAEGYPFPVPEIIATFPGDKIAPPCNKMTYAD